MDWNGLRSMEKAKKERPHKPRVLRALFLMKGILTLPPQAEEFVSHEPKKQKAVQGLPVIVVDPGDGVQVGRDHLQHDDRRRHARVMTLNTMDLPDSSDTPTSDKSSGGGCSAGVGGLALLAVLVPLLRKTRK